MPIFLLRSQNSPRRLAGGSLGPCFQKRTRKSGGPRALSVTQLVGGRARAILAPAPGPWQLGGVPRPLPEEFCRKTCKSIPSTFLPGRCLLWHPTLALRRRSICSCITHLSVNSRHPSFPAPSWWGQQSLPGPRQPGPSTAQAARATSRLGARAGALLVSEGIGSQSAGRHAPGCQPSGGSTLAFPFT